jgi:hypothetical protein
VHIYNLFVHYAMHWNVMIIAVVQFAAISIAYGRVIYESKYILFRCRKSMCRHLQNVASTDKRRSTIDDYANIRTNWYLYSTCMELVVSDDHYGRCMEQYYYIHQILLVCDILVKSDESEMNRHLSSSLLWHLLALVPLVPIPAFAFWEYCHKVRMDWE